MNTNGQNKTMSYYKPLNPNAKNCLSCGELVEDGSDSDYCAACWEDKRQQVSGKHHHWNQERFEVDDYGIYPERDDSEYDDTDAETESKHSRWHPENLDLDEYSIYPSPPMDRHGNIRELRF